MSKSIGVSPAGVPVTPPAVPVAQATGRLASLRDDVATITPARVRLGLRLVEYFILFGAGVIAYAVHVAGTFGLLDQYILPLLVVPLVAILWLDQIGGYRIEGWTKPTLRAWRLVVAWTGAMVVLVAAAFFFKAGEEYSRFWVGLWYALGLGGLLASRVATRLVATSWAKSGRLDRRAVIVGGGEPAAALIRALEASRSANIRIVGLFDDRGAERIGIVANYPVLGSFDDLAGIAREKKVDLVIVALPLTAENRLLHLLKKLWVLPVDVRVSALSSRLRFRPRAYSHIGDVPFVDIFDRPLSGGDVMVKAAFDRIIGAAALVALAPVMALVALAVRLDSKGPVLFKQKRHGFNNELIEVYKFRSMYVNQSDATAAKLVTKGDPRVTRVGRFIRKTSLDELPQLFNVVFKGNLSLVGPRPHAVHAKAADHLYQDVVDGYYARHKVKPGITGWAQIHGWRGETDTAEKIQRRVEHDLHYIESWSPLLDLYILAMTPVSLVTKTENAY
jgi:Undecaprenyl-phosphate glucose phosphotransferase